MIIQTFAVILVCLAAAVFALAIASVSLSAFARFLKRAERANEEQGL